MSNHDSGIIVDEIIGSIGTKVLNGRNLKEVAEKVKEKGGSVSARRLELALLKMKKTISRDCREAAEWLNSHGFSLSKNCFA